MHVDNDKVKVLRLDGLMEKQIKNDKDPRFNSEIATIHCAITSHYFMVPRKRKLQPQGINVRVLMHTNLVCVSVVFVCILWGSNVTQSVEVSRSCTYEIIRN